MGRPVKCGFSYGGVWRTVYEWGKVLGIPVKTLKHRVYAGWSPEDIVKTPPGQPRGGLLGARCRGCHHWRLLSGFDGLKCCHYFWDTGELRRVPYEKCERRRNCG